MLPEVRNIGSGYFPELIPGQFHDAEQAAENEAVPKVEKIANFAINALVDLAQRTKTTWYLRGILVDSTKSSDGVFPQTAHLIVSSQPIQDELEQNEKYTNTLRIQYDEEKWGNVVDKRDVDDAEEDTKSDEKKVNPAKEATSQKVTDRKLSETSNEDGEEDNLRRPEFIHYVIGGEGNGYLFPILVRSKEEIIHFGPKVKMRDGSKVRINTAVTLGERTYLVFWDGQAGAKEYKMRCKSMRIMSDSELGLVNEKGKVKNQGVFLFPEGGYSSVEVNDEDYQDGPDRVATKELFVDEFFDKIEWMIEAPQIADSLIAAFRQAGAKI